MVSTFLLEQISRNDPQRQFIIGIKVSDSGVYFAPECNPPLPAEQLEEMLAEVNRTNRFGGFVSRVRRGFVSLAEAGL